MSLLRHGLAAVLLAAAATQVAAAPTPASVQVDELTWTELRDAIKAGKTTVIVPVGGTEQSGPHMALGKHNVRARALAGAHRGEPRQRARRAGDRVRPGRRDQSAGRAHALRRHDQHPRERVRGDARGRGAELSPGRLSRHRPARRSRRVSERAWPRSPPSSTASGRRGRCACTRSTSTTAPPSATSRRPCAARLQRRRDRHACRCSPTRRSRSPSTAQLVRSRSCRRQRARPRRRRVRRSAPGQRRRRPGRRRADRRAHPRRDPARGRASVTTCRRFAVRGVASVVNFPEPPT